ncbi:MAG: copper resistance protein B [Steroidobacteraceae bacterium]
MPSNGVWTWSLSCLLAAGCASAAAARTDGIAVARADATVLRVDLLEWQGRPQGDTLKWDIEASTGVGRHRVLLRDEGHKMPGTPLQNRVELLWQPPRFWDSVRWLDRLDWLNLFVGVRHDTGEAPTRTFAALGVYGRSPWGIHVDITGYLGEGSPGGDPLHNGYRFQLDYAHEFNPRLALLARFDYEIFSEDHVWYSFGIPPTETSFGLRVRYRLDAQWEPYVGAEWFEYYGDSRDIALQRGEPASDIRMVAGVRVRLSQ